MGYKSWPPQAVRTSLSSSVRGSQCAHRYGRAVGRAFAFSSLSIQRPDLVLSLREAVLFFLG